MNSIYFSFFVRNLPKHLALGGSLRVGHWCTLDVRVIQEQALVCCSSPLRGSLWTARLQAVMSGLSLNWGVDSEIVVVEMRDVSSPSRTDGDGKESGLASGPIYMTACRFFCFFRFRKASRSYVS